MKTLFLDFDGTLHPVNGRAFVHVQALANVIEGHVVQIVVTSSARIFQPAEHIILQLGPLGGRVVGETPFIDKGISRQREVAAYVNEHNINDFRVLDDEPLLFMPSWTPLILCDHRIGLDATALHQVKIWLGTNAI
jgi:hypothetical protein